MVRGSTVRGGTSSSKKTQKVTGCKNPFLLVLPTAEEEAVLYLESGVGHTTSRNAHLHYDTKFWWGWFESLRCMV